MASAARSQRPMLAYPNAAPAAVPRVQLLALSPDGEKPPPTFKEIMSKAAKRALGGGLPGAVAMGVQVTTLMWMRTTMNYQYRHGTSTTQAWKKLYADGGVRRFYRGYGPALFQGPLSRFGDTAANSGMLSLLDSKASTRDLPIPVKTACASTAAALWRIALMPIDATKTIMQVEGKEGFGMLVNKVRHRGPTVLYHGALAASSATFVGHLPWFTTFNFLNARLPKYDDPLKKLGRNALIGFSASVVSDCSSNSIRVVKTYKQTHAEGVSYPQAVKNVIAQDGIIGLFGRGLRTRILANGMQGIMFTIVWRYFEEKFRERGF